VAACGAFSTALHLALCRFLDSPLVNPQKCIAKNKLCVSRTGGNLWRPPLQNPNRRGTLQPQTTTPDSRLGMDGRGGSPSKVRRPAAYPSGAHWRCPEGSYERIGAVSVRPLSRLPPTRWEENLRPKLCPLGRSGGVLGNRASNSTRWVVSVAAEAAFFSPTQFFES
jgi:hypothetical protein